MRTSYKPYQAVEEADCIIFTLSESVSSKIQLQRCTVCSSAGRRRRFVGPETWELGIFNFNNRFLFTHDLLDDYTSAFTSSETPFSAWTAGIVRRYATHDSAEPFTSEEVFRAAWFAYVKLQQFDGDMRCSSCGPIPQQVMFDGVTSGFNEKHILPSLQPPTVTHSNSTVRKSNYIGKQQVIADSKLRKLVKKITSKAPPSLPPVDSSGERSLPAQAGYIADMQSIVDAGNGLHELEPSLGTIFRENFGARSILSGKTILGVYRRLFKQVSSNRGVLR